MLNVGVIVAAAAYAEKTLEDKTQIKDLSHKQLER